VARSAHQPHLPSFPTRRSSDLPFTRLSSAVGTFEPSVKSPSWNDRMFRLSWKWKKLHPNWIWWPRQFGWSFFHFQDNRNILSFRSEEHTSELQSLTNLVCRLLL